MLIFCLCKKKLNYRLINLINLDVKSYHKCLFLLCLVPAWATAQSNFQPASIVNSKGDTVRGTVDYGNWEYSPKSILFKPVGSGTPQKLTAADVKFFSVSIGQLAAFEGYAGRITTDNTEVNRISSGRDTSFKIDTVFLRVIQDGRKLKLFSYTDGQKTRFFIAENFIDRPRELTYRIYFDKEDADGVNHTVYETAFKGQLYDEAVKFGVMSAALKSNISRATYTEGDIAKIAAAINGISADDLSKNNQKKIKPLHIAIIAAAVVALAYWVIHDFASIHTLK